VNSNKNLSVTQYTKDEKTIFLLQMVKGALIGICSILPGVSGGVLAVVFGIYKPLMAFLAHPIARLKQCIPLLPVLVGCLAGVLLLSKAIGVLLERCQVPMLCVFAGLMVRSIPSLYIEARDKSRSHHEWIYAAVATILAAAWLFIFVKDGFHQPSFTTWW